MGIVKHLFKTYKYKKPVFLFIAFLFFFSAAVSPLSTKAVTASAGEIYETHALIYAFSDYTISLRNASFKIKDDGLMLTDGKYSSVEVKKDKINADGWVAVKSYNGSSDYRMTVTVDYGYTAKGVCLFFARVAQNTKANANRPERVRFYVSENGTEFELVGDGATMTDPEEDETSAVFRLNTYKKHDVRYVRAVFDCKAESDLYVNEFGSAASGTVFRANAHTNEEIIDSQGLLYKISDGFATVTGRKSATGTKPGILSPSKADFNESGIVYTLGAGTGNPVKVISDFIGEGKINYSGIPNRIKYIVIHNTATVEEVTDAERYNYRLHNSEKESSWHYTVDDGIIYHSLADNIVGWHAGSTHNYESIGIEICTNGAPVSSSGRIILSGEKYDAWVENRFRKSLKNTAVLTAELLTRYGLGLDAVIQHYDVTEKNCPLWMRSKDGTFVYEGTLWIEFMEYVKTYYKMFNGINPYRVISYSDTAVIPDYITLIDGDVYPVEAIGSDAFCYQEDSVKNIKIGKNVKSIARDCFYGSDSIEKIEVDSENTYFYSDADGILYDIKGNVVFDPKTNTSIVPSPKDGCSLDIRSVNGRYYIFLKNEGYSLEQLAREYGASAFSAVSQNGEAISKKSVPGTGAVLNFDGARLYIVLMGDVNGDAEITPRDYALVKRTYLKTYNPTKAQLFAMAISNGERVTVQDYTKIKRHVLGTRNLFAK